MGRGWPSGLGLPPGPAWQDSVRRPINTLRGRVYSSAVAVLPTWPELCYNLWAMWIGVEIAAYLSLVLGYVLLLVLAIRNRLGRGRAQRLLELILLVGALWTAALAVLAITTGGDWWDYVWNRTAHLGLVLLALLTAEFAEAFVDRRRGHLRLVVVALLFVASAVLDFWPFGQVIVVSPTPLLRIGPTELATTLLFLAWSVPTIAAWRTSLWALRRATGSKHRNRIRYLQTCLLCLTAGDLIVFAGGDPEAYVGFTIRLLGLSVVVLTLLRYDLPDLRRLALVLLRAVLLTVLTAALYFLVLMGVGLLAERSLVLTRAASIVPALILAVFLAAVVDVTLAPRLHRFFDQRVLGQRHDVQRALRAHSQQVNLILDLERLADSTLDWLRGTLRARRLAFILLTPRTEGQYELRILRGTVSPRKAVQLFARDSRFMVHFRKIGRPLSQYDLDMLSWFQDMTTDEREWLRSLEVDLYVPALVADNPVALLALGPKADDQPYSQEDLETLMILAGQTGTAVENARLVDDLRAVQGDIQRLNSELAETNRQLARLDQAKTDFVAIASHELRTPLSQITGYSDVLSSLEDDELGDAQMVQKVLEGIARGAARIKRVVDAMVDVSLIETGELRMNLGAVSVGAVVAYAVAAMELAASDRDMTISVAGLSELPNIRADRARLEQVLLGLVNNAVKFTPNGRRIEISGGLDPSSSAGAHVELCIADEGIGIDPEQTTLIFEKFYRPENPLLHSTNESGFKGAGPGLGLAIAKGIVEAHGGRIWVDSAGRDEETCPGSSFYVRLPVEGPEES